MITFEGTQQNESFEEIVEHNLSMMEGPLDKLRETESLGGGATYDVVDGKKYPCYGLNGYIDPSSGKIMMFGNFPQITPEMIKGLVQFTFREACNFSGIVRGNSEGKERKILQVYGLDGVLEDIRRVISESVKRYNDIHWA